MASCGPIGRSFFFNDTATTEIYTLSLHDALPICRFRYSWVDCQPRFRNYWQPSRPNSLALWGGVRIPLRMESKTGIRSEEHTSELQSHLNLVCRLLLEKKNVAVRRIDARA